MTLPGVAVGHAADLLQLLDQVDLGVQAPGRVGQHQVVAPGRGPLHGVEDDGARVAALGTADDLGAGALGPHAQLVGGGGPEGVPGGQQDRSPGGRLPPGQLADGGRLAHAVDPDDQPDVGLARTAVEAQVARVRRRLEHPWTSSPRAPSSSVATGDLLGLHLGPQSASSESAVATPTSARMSASSSESQVASSIRAATAGRSHRRAEQPADVAQTAAVGRGGAGASASGGAVSALGRSASGRGRLPRRRCCDVAPRLRPSSVGAVGGAVGWAPSDGRLGRRLGRSGAAGATVRRRPARRERVAATDDPATRPSDRHETTTLSMTGCRSAGSLDLLADDLRRPARRHRHPVERVARLHGALLVAHDEQLRLVAELVDEAEEAVRLTSSSAASTSSIR